MPRDAVARRGLDLIVAAIGLVISSPILGLAALYLRLGLRGPVFTREERVGRGGMTFQLHRLSTTRGGRGLEVLGIAAIPELVNVLKGEMSIVGPRPAAPAAVSWYTPSETRRIRSVPV